MKPTIFTNFATSTGIMVWEDFIGACACYPGYDDEFYQNYRAEISLYCAPTLAVPFARYTPATTK